MQDERAVAHAELVEMLKDGLARAGLTKTRLAARTGLGRTTVQNAFTTEAAVPSAATAVALAKALNLPDQELLDLRRAAARSSCAVEGRSDAGSGAPAREGEGELSGAAGAPSSQGHMPAGGGSHVGHTEQRTDNRVSDSTVHGDVYLGRDLTLVTQHPRPARPVLDTLPSEASVFVGREDDLKRLLEKLAPAAEGAKETVVSVLTGMAGVGKTALAVTAARRALAAGTFKAVHYLDFRGYSSNPDDPPLTASQAVDELLGWLGVPAAQEQPPRGRIGSYQNELSTWANDGRRVLLVADNVSSLGQVAELLPGNRSHRVLLTTRSADLAPAGSARIAVEVLDHGDTAVELLDTLLRASDTGDDRITAAGEEATALARVCGHLPLALEIAVGLLALRPESSVATLTRELSNDRYRLDDLRLDPTRAVRAAFDLSYRHLEAAQARMFALLALVPGPQADVDAAAALADLDTGRARRLLLELRWAHLIGPGSSDGHYRFHDLVRLYAAEIAEHHLPDERDVATDRLLDHYVRITRAADSHLDAEKPDDPRFAGRQEALKWLGTERPGLVAAVTLAARTTRDAHTRDLARALSFFLDMGVHWHDLTAVAQLAVDATRRLCDLLGESRALRSLAVANESQWRLREALGHYGQALVVAGKAGDRPEEAHALIGLGTIHWRLRQYDDAITHYEEALALYAALTDRSGQARAQHSLGLVLGEMGRFDEAFGHYRTALAVYRQLRDRYRESRLLDAWGGDLTDAERFDEALERHHEALAIRRRLRDRRGEAGSLNSIGVVHFRRDPGSGASLEYYKQALPVFRELGYRHAEVTCLINIAAATQAAGDREAAIPKYLEALPLLQELEDRREKGRALAGLGNCYLFLERHEEAEPYLREAIAILRQEDDHAGEAPLLIFLGTVHTRAGRYNESIECHHRALTLQRQLRDRANEGTTLNGLGSALITAGRLDEAVATLREALAVHREVGNDFAMNLTQRTIAAIAHHQGRLDEAIDHYRQSLPWLEEHGTAEEVTVVKNALSALYEATSAAGPDPGDDGADG